MKNLFTLFKRKPIEVIVKITKFEIGKTYLGKMNRYNDCIEFTCIKRDDDTVLFTYSYFSNYHPTNKIGLVIDPASNDGKKAHENCRHENWEIRSCDKVIKEEVKS